jgi:hypothetical protein
VERTDADLADRRFRYQEYGKYCADQKQADGGPSGPGAEDPSEELSASTHKAPIVTRCTVSMKKSYQVEYNVSTNNILTDSD